MLLASCPGSCGISENRAWTGEETRHEKVIPASPACSPYPANRTVIAAQALKGKELRIDARCAPSTYINQDGAQGSSSLTSFLFPSFLPSLYPPNSPHESLFLVSENAIPHSPSDRTPSRRLSCSFPPPPESSTPWLKAPQYR